MLKLKQINDFLDVSVHQHPIQSIQEKHLPMGSLQRHRNVSVFLHPKPCSQMRGYTYGAVRAKDDSRGFVSQRAWPKRHCQILIYVNREVCRTQEAKECLKVLQK